MSIQRNGESTAYSSILDWANVIVAIVIHFNGVTIRFVTPRTVEAVGARGSYPPQILTEQLTLSQPGGISCLPNYCLPPGFSDLPTIRDPNAPFAKYTHVCFSKTPCSIAIFAWADLQHHHIIIIHYVLGNFPGPELKRICCYLHFLNLILTSEG